MSDNMSPFQCPYLQLWAAQENYHIKSIYVEFYAPQAKTILREVEELVRGRFSSGKIRSQI
jgi:hypothetical protein